MKQYTHINQLRSTFATAIVSLALLGSSATLRADYDYTWVGDPGTDLQFSFSISDEKTATPFPFLFVNASDLISLTAIDPANPSRNVLDTSGVTYFSSALLNPAVWPDPSHFGDVNLTLNPGTPQEWLGSTNTLGTATGHWEVTHSVTDPAPAP